MAAHLCIRAWRAHPLGANALLGRGALLWLLRFLLVPHGNLCTALLRTLATAAAAAAAAAAATLTATTFAAAAAALRRVPRGDLSAPLRRPLADRLAAATVAIVPAPVPAPTTVALVTAPVPVPVPVAVAAVVVAAAAAVFVAPAVLHLGQKASLQLGGNLLEVPAMCIYVWSSAESPRGGSRGRSEAGCITVALC